MLRSSLGQRVQSRALPAYTGGARPLGATFNRSQTNRRLEPFADVEGIPRAKMRGMSGGGVSTDLDFTSKYADLMTYADLKEFYAAVDSMVGQAQRLSQGGLSLKQLRQMGHPYGMGRRAGLGRLRGSGRGVSNMAVVNKQSGDFYKAWSADTKPRRGGMRAQLINSQKYAKYLAYGTKRMKPHYPGPTVVAKELTELRRLWRKAARGAWARNNALAQFEGSLNGR